MRKRHLPLLPALLLALASGCASSVVAVQDRTVHDELESVAWRPAVPGDVVGHWRARSIHGPAAGVLLDLGYWIDADGHFSGAALFAGPPPTYEVLSGAWTFLEDGALRLGEDAEPAQAEVGPGDQSSALLRLTGADGSLVLERAELR